MNAARRTYLLLDPPVVPVPEVLPDPDVPMLEELEEPVPEVPVPVVPVPEVPVPEVPVPDAPLEPDEPLDPWLRQSLLSEPEPVLPALDDDVPEPDMPLDDEVPLDWRLAQSVLFAEPAAPLVLVPPPDAPLELVPPELEEPAVPLAPVLPEGHVPEGHD